MGKIIGESFNPYVAEQIKVRQKKLGAENRDPDVLAYTTSKTSWLRLTSGVDIDESKLKELGRPNQGLEKNKLAESYVLFGGANNVSRSSMPKGGFLDSYSNSLSQNTSYGFNSEKEYGIVPLPGIESAEIIPKNRGSLREANIVIKAFNREQFNIIETLYLRLKYSILLEWGHTMYFDNKESLKTILTDSVYKEFLKTTPIVTGVASDIGFGGFAPETDPKDIGIDVNSNQNKILDLIKNQRKKSDGNYDGFLGWVQNFSWDLSPEGVYTINLKAISYGDIIESLSITKPSPISNKSPDESSSGGSPLEILLNTFKNLLNKTSDLDDYSSKVKKLKDVWRWWQNPGTYIDGKDLDEDFIKTLLATGNNPFYPSKNFFTNKELLYFDSRWIPNNPDQYYIKLGSLLRIINNFFTVYDYSKPNNPPLVSIDYNYEDTFCSILKNLVPVDPKVCLIPSNIEYNDVFSLLTDFELLYINVSTGGNANLDKGKINLKEFNEFVGTDFLTPDLYKAKPLHIHVNIDFIITQLNSNLDKNGDLSSYDFLTAILNGINSALGGTIDLGINYDEEINTYFIIDNNPPIKPFTEAKPPDPTKINIKSFQGNFGSFVKSFSIKSEISNKLSTQIAIGAQANNTSLGSDSVAFSRWNLGLTDRIIATKSFSSNTTINDYSESSSRKDLVETLVYLLTLNRGTELGRLEKYKQNIVNYLKIERDIEVLEGNLLSKSFIPISLNLELDGISGIKRFQKYTINDEILPQNYRNNIEFLTKGLRHSIDQSGWTTSIEGLSIPKQK